MSRGYAAVDGELEDELSRELEAEFEDELEGSLGELAHELEYELEDEDEALYEFEDEDELGELAQELEDELEDEDEALYEFEFEDEAEFEAEFENLVRELEAEFEFEDEFEGEDFANPLRRLYPDADQLARLAFQAEQAETEDEAEAFIGPLAALAVRALPRLAPAVRAVAPKIVRGATTLGRKLWRNLGTRHLVRRIPQIVKRTAGRVKARVRRGQGPFALTPGWLSNALIGSAVSFGADKLLKRPKKQKARPKQVARRRATAQRTRHRQPARRTPQPAQRARRRATPARRARGRARRR